MNRSGWYKMDGEDLLHSPNIVESAEYLLIAEFREDYDLPVGGWYWFDSEEEANSFFRSEK